MKEASAWATVICLSAVCATILNFINVKGAMEKIFRFVLGVFMICAIISPLSNFSIDLNQVNISGQENISNEIADTVKEQEITLAKSNISTLIGNELKKENIKFKNININMDTSDKDSISITKVLVTLNKADLYNSKIIKKIIKEKFNLESEIYIERNDENE